MRPRADCTTAATIEATDTDTRVMRGIAVPYGQPGNTFGGPGRHRRRRRTGPGRPAARECCSANTADRSRSGTPSTPPTETDALRMGFTLARTEDGDRALLEASEGLRDAFSVELDNVEIRAGHVVGADLVAVAQVAVPAFAAAQLNAADTDTPPPPPSTHHRPTPSRTRTPTPPRRKPK